MTAAMLNADKSACGSLTTGGTESVLMAVKAYRLVSSLVSVHLPAISHESLSLP